MGGRADAAPAAGYGAWHANLTAFVAANADLPAVAISVACAGILANPKIADNQYLHCKLEQRNIHQTGRAGT
jgi:hypothetical protein